MRHLSAGIIFFVALSSAAFAQEGTIRGVPSDAIQQWRPVTPTRVSVPSAAQPGYRIESEGSGAIPALPLSVMTNGEITYLTGGIGDEEEAQLKATANEYNLRMMMTGRGGEYISDVALRVLDSSGAEIFTVPAAGPYFYAHLKPGHYTIEMTPPGGDAKRLKVNVPARGAARQQVSFAGELGGVTTVRTPQAKVD